MWYTSGMAVRAGTLTGDERASIKRLASSRTARQVERAQIVRLAAEGRTIANWVDFLE